ncbi:PREDICTED: extracellular matrix protein FRAS1-like [Thamnophis sirtalis]|uniref:Extracellular matrix protein FRAS1-like n=1 Tax=Thamnophis sirtalis TaxID=35019 RepID=A0A6I9YVD1_9SAUR|nr:PREDICTED: extracellular matrix protein FRAS1-like [Thamnophis sirtalis]
MTKSCLPLDCRQGESKVRRPGRCCEECVLSKGSCVHNGTLKYHSDMWHDTDCNFCSCDGGRVACRKAKCAKVDCGQGEELSHLSGKCCPECILRGASCVYKDSTKDVSSSLI